MTTAGASLGFPAPAAPPSDRSERVLGRQGTTVTASTTMDIASTPSQVAIGDMLLRGLPTPSEMRTFGISHPMSPPGSSRWQRLGGVGHHGHRTGCDGSDTEAARDIAQVVDNRRTNRRTVLDAWSDWSTALNGRVPRLRGWARSESQIRDLPFALVDIDDGKSSTTNGTA